LTRDWPITVRWTDFLFLICAHPDSRILGTVYVESVLGKDNFEPELFPHDVEKVSFDTALQKSAHYSAEDLKEFIS